MKDTEKKFEYPHVDFRGEKRYVRIPLQFFKKDVSNDIVIVGHVPEGKWVAVDVHVDGYSHLLSPHPYDSEEECKEACNVHNRYWGWNQQQAFEIEAMSFGVLEWPSSVVNVNNDSQ